MIKFEKKKIKFESLQRTCCVRLFLILGTLLKIKKGVLKHSTSLLIVVTKIIEIYLTYFLSIYV